MEAHQMPLDTQQELRRLPGNNRCVDCDAPYPQWATVSYGTFMCLECSGRHRGLGVHISFVRSVTMDSWTDKQIQMMQLGGNDKFREAFVAAGVPTNLSIQQKYNTPQAEAYRKRLTAQVENKPAVALPRWDPSCIKPAAPSSGSFGSSSAGGDTRGVEALKGESEQDYVARQMRLRDEARARMQAKFGAGGMQGIGSNGETGAPPSAGVGGITDLSSAFGFISSTVTSTVSTAASLVKEQDLTSKVSSGWSYVQTTITDPNLTHSVKSTASTGWSTLTSGASAVWRTAQSVVVNSPREDDTSMFPRNASLQPTGRYSGMGNENGVNMSAKDHDNDSWLDAQLASQKNSSPIKANSFGGSGHQSSFTSTHANSFTASSSSSTSPFKSAPLSAPSMSSSANSAPPPAPLSAPAPAPVPVPAPKPKEKKKDVDFFGEFGF